MVDNRIIVDWNSKTNSLETLVTSYHIETKSKSAIIVKKMKFYIKSSSFKDVSLFIFFKALGVESEQVGFFVGTGRKSYSSSEARSTSAKNCC
jgi:DNA-directed RNA polymerase beta subunit